jgi:hypothetical protein
LPASLKPGTILKEQPNKETLEGHIASLLIRIAKMYQIPNFDEESALILAIDTIERFQYDPVDVLVKCLTSPPSTGEKNWRLTPDTISEWMSITLEREADRIEREHQNVKMKKVEFEVPADTTPETEKMIQDFMNSLSDFKKVPALSEDYIKENGQRKPKKVSYSSGWVQPSEEDVVMSELKRRWMLANFDPITGKELDGFISFDEWILL